MAKYLAPEVLSNQGRALIILLWAIMIAFSVIGASQMESNFSMEFFLVEGQPITKFVKLNAAHF